MALKRKSKCVSTSLTCTIEFLHEEVKLSNTRTAYVMHIPNIMSLISARNNCKCGKRPNKCQCRRTAATSRP